jgi:hypothetical protein
MTQNDSFLLSMLEYAYGDEGAPPKRQPQPDELPVRLRRLGRKKLPG